jgi:peptidoglycan/xylan/chitin deacetylase (PgdA/CDA1 family)
MRVPVLCYHRVEVPPDGAEHDSNFVTPQRFAEHLRMLKSFGYTAVTVRDIARWQRGATTLPARSIGITFDDAYDSVLRHAIPLLDSYNWPCTIYVVSSQIGGTSLWDDVASRARLLDATTLSALAHAGHEIGSHSRNHRRIRGLDDASARDELRVSRASLESSIGAPVDSFAFPYGSHDARALQQVRDAGYGSACTLKRWANGRRTNPLRLGRMSVGGPLSAPMLAVKLLKLHLTPSRG